MILFSNKLKAILKDYTGCEVNYAKNKKEWLQMMSLDPKVSGLEGVVLTEDMISGISGFDKKAFVNVHPDLNILVILSNPKVIPKFEKIYHTDIDRIGCLRISAVKLNPKTKDVLFKEIDKFLGEVRLPGGYVNQAPVSNSTGVPLEGFFHQDPSYDLSTDRTGINASSFQISDTLTIDNKQTLDIKTRCIAGSEECSDFITQSNVLNRQLGNQNNAPTIGIGFGTNETPSQPFIEQQPAQDTQTTQNVQSGFSGGWDGAFNSVGGPYAPEEPQFAQPFQVVKPEDKEEPVMQPAAQPQEPAQDITQQSSIPTPEPVDTNFSFNEYTVPQVSGEKEPDVIKLNEPVEDNAVQDLSKYKGDLDLQARIKVLLDSTQEYVDSENQIHLIHSQINHIFLNPNFSEIERWEKVSQLVKEIRAWKATSNSTMVSSVSELLDTITTSFSKDAGALVSNLSKRVNECRKPNNEIILSKAEEVLEIYNKRQSAINDLIGLQLYTRKLQSGIAEAGINLKKEMIKDLPTPFASINERFVGNATELIPANMDELIVKVNTLIKEHLTQYSLVENKINSVLEALTSTVALDNILIEKQMETIEWLYNHKISDNFNPIEGLASVVRLHLCSRAEHDYVLASLNVGSLRGTSLVFDSSLKVGSYKKYGIQTYGLDQTVKDEDFTVMLYDMSEDAPKVLRVAEEFYTAYKYIDIIIPVEEYEAYKDFYPNAKEIFYYTTGDFESLQIAKEAFKNTESASGRKVIILIDPPADIMPLVLEVQGDHRMTRVITVPSIPELKSVSMRGVQPKNSLTISSVIKEAFGGL